MNNNWIIRKKVDLQNGLNGIIVWPNALMLTGNKNAHTIVIEVYDGGKPVALDGSVRGWFVRPDGETVMLDGSVSGNEASVTLDSNCYAYDGDLQSVINYQHGDDVVTLSAFLFRVNEITTDQIVDPGNVIPSLDELLARIKELEEALDKTNEAAESAKTAAENADQKATEAVEAAELAKGAKTAADEAAQAANDASDTANNSAKLADAAAERAIQAAGMGLKKELLDHIPEPSEMVDNVIYLVPAAEPNPDNVHEEYMLIDGQRELIGSTAVDLTGYAKKDELAEVATSGSYADLSGTKNVATKEYVGEKIDGIEIGGTNLLPDTNVNTLTRVAGPWNRYFSDSNISNVSIGFVNLNDPPIDAIKYGVELSITEHLGHNRSRSLAWYQGSNNIALISGETYTVSCWARATSGKPILQFLIGDGGGTQGYLRKFVTVESNSWKRFSFTTTYNKTLSGNAKIYFGNRDMDDISNAGDTLQICGFKLEYGDKATDWTPAPDDVEHTISRRAAITYDYGGRDLKEIFGTPAALQKALAAEDYSQIAVGDYWPVTLNGKFWDYGSYTVKSGVAYYSNNTLQTQVGTTTATYQGAYVSDTAVSFALSGNTYYVAISDCLDYFARTCNNVSLKLEVAGINFYSNFGDTGELSNGKPNIVFVSRDCLPFLMRLQKNKNKFENDNETNPWRGSALYKTLNDESHGILALMKNTDIFDYIYKGPSNQGMRACLEKKDKETGITSGWGYQNRGILFLPSETEIFGYTMQSAPKQWYQSLNLQFPIFRDSYVHITKKLGENGSRSSWWTSTSAGDRIFAFIRVVTSGFSDQPDTNSMQGVPVCFVIT